MSNRLLLIGFLVSACLCSNAQERNKPIPCDLTITSLAPNDIYLPTDTGHLFCQIEITKISDWKLLDTLMLRTITELNVSEEMFLAYGTLPLPSLPEKENYEIIIASAAVYFHSDNTVEFGIDPDYHHYLVAKRKKGTVAIRESGYCNLNGDWSNRNRGPWYRFRSERISKNCVALIRIK
ncbi:hypothetical protein N9J52_01490 [Flavobacteriales bacterium]|nr:hypothetical protein [Flavobacteriales bacterium]